MRYQIELTHSNPIPTAVVRSRVPAKELAQFVPAACGEVWPFIRSAGLPRPGRHLALYLDAGGSVEVGAELGTCVVAQVSKPAVSPHFQVGRSCPYQRARKFSRRASLETCDTAGLEA